MAHDLTARAACARLDKEARQNGTHKRPATQDRDAEAPVLLSSRRLHVFGDAVSVHDAEYIQRTRPELEGYAARRRAELGD